LSLQPLFHLSKEGEKMHQYKLGVLNGDGIGPEIVKSTVDVITAAIARVGGSTLEYIPLPMGWEGITKYDAPVPEFTKAEEVRWLADGPSRFRSLSTGPSGQAQPQWRIETLFRPVLQCKASPFHPRMQKPGWGRR
jgi:hypothetical protein